MEDVNGSYVPLSPQPITNLRPLLGPQLRLYQHQPLSVDAGYASNVYWSLAYNMILSNDRPGQPALLGAYNSPDPWTNTVICPPPRPARPPN